ncbi:MAG: hypothetical protein WBM07_17100 [Chitinivibrionales bacterium]
MNKGASQQKNIDGLATEEANEQLAPGFDDSFNEWLESIGLKKNDYTFNVFLRREKPDKTIEYVRCWKNSFPSIDEIGETFGTGKAIVDCQVWTGKGAGQRETKRNVILFDESWTERKRQAEDAKRQAEEVKRGTAAPASMSGAQGQGMQGGNLSNAIADARAIVGLVEGLLKTANEAKPQSNGALDIIKLTNEIAQEQLKQNFKIVNQARRNMLNAAEEATFDVIPRQGLPAPQEQEEMNPIVDMIVDLVEEYAPQILGGGPVAEKLVGTVKALIAKPAIKPITQDPNAMRRIIAAVNAKHGPVETRRLFEMIGFKI